MSSTVSMLIPDVFRQLLGSSSILKIEAIKHMRTAPESILDIFCQSIPGYKTSK